MATPTILAGFKRVPTGRFVAGPHQGVQVKTFGMKATPVTNAEYCALARSLGQNRFVLLEHDFQSGESKIIRKDATAEAAAAGPAFTPGRINFNQGGVMMLGSMILVKMVDNPSAKYDDAESVFSGANQPAVGVTYFHAKAWCLLESLRSYGEYTYDLPTDMQYEYVASDRGTKEFGTETGTLFDEHGRKLAHIDENSDLKSTTVSVNDPRYAQNWPFGIDATGNVYRLTKFNPEVRACQEYYWGPYAGPFGRRGGSWDDNPDFGRAACRLFYHPGHHGASVGFSPVVVLPEVLR